MCKVCPFTVIPYSMRVYVCRYVELCDGKYLNRVQQGASEASPLLIIMKMEEGRYCSTTLSTSKDAGN